MVEIKNGELELPCPNCEQMSRQPIILIRDNDVLPCSLCGGLIDLDSDECRPLVEPVKNGAVKA